METNKEARRVLNRHGVDLTYCYFSCSAMEVRLTGWLCRTNGSDYNGPQIEAMIQDFERQLPGYRVFGDLENWNFTSERITYIGEKDGSKVRSSGEEGPDEHHQNVDLEESA